MARLDAELEFILADVIDGRDSVESSNAFVRFVR